MFNRTYFFTIESLPPLRKERIDKGLITCASGFVHYRSFFSNPERCKECALKQVINDGLIDDKVMMTSMARV